MDKNSHDESIFKREDHNRILLINENPHRLEATLRIFDETEYSVTACDDIHEALDNIKCNDYDVVLSDIRMPSTSGIDLVEKIHKLDAHLPVILMTAYADMKLAVHAISRGAFDFIIKPSSPEYVLLAVKKAVQQNNYLQLTDNYEASLQHIVRQSTEEYDTASRFVDIFSNDLVERLTTVAEFRDTEAGAHVSRIGIYSSMIAEALGMPAEFARTIKYASPMHDIGKIGITDYILFKMQPLTSEEFEIFKSHTSQGQRILSGSCSPTIKMAESIALNHHEKWDGSGYPNGLKGEDIPIEGRIVILADQYDVIRSERIYKPEYTHEETVDIITKGDKRTLPQHFDPDVLHTFTKKSAQFQEVYKSFED